MKVITRYPVYINRTRVNNNSMYLSVDGSSSKSEVQAFQDWLDMKHPGWVLGKNLNKGSGYGNFGPATSSAWGKYSTEYTAFITPTTTTTQTTTTQTTTEPTSQKKDEMKKKGFNWDKAKGTWTKAKDSGLIDNLLGLFGKDKPTEQAPQEGGGPSVTPPPTDDKKGMSKGMKIGLAVGGALLLGTVLYFAFHKKPTPAKA